MNLKDLRNEVFNHKCIWLIVFTIYLQDEMETFLTVLALCHNVRVDQPQAAELGASTMYSYNGYEYDYQASSPDEKAFVEACRR